MFYGSSAPAAVYYYSTATRGTSAMEMRTTSYHLRFLVTAAASGYYYASKPLEVW